MIFFGLRVCVVSGCFGGMLPDVLSCVCMATLAYTHTHTHIHICIYIQGDSFARGPKLLSIKNYVIEIMT